VLYGAPLSSKRPTRRTIELVNETAVLVEDNATITRIAETR